MTIPKPDFSASSPSLHGEADGRVDFAWNEGEFSDGRPYRIEAWALDGCTFVTVFTPTEGLEHCSGDDLAELLERERVVCWVDGAHRSAFAVPVADDAGRPTWSINVTIGWSDEPPVAETTGLRGHAKR